MPKYCQDCQKVVDDQFVLCPDCRGHLNEKISSPITLSEEQLDSIVDTAVKRTTSKMWKRLWLALSIIAIGNFVWSGWTLENLYNKAVGKIEKTLNARVEKEFETERIKSTVLQIAENQSQQIIHDRLEPSINDATALIEKRTGKFKTTLNEFTAKYDAETDVLTEEITFLKQRNDILKLRDEAMATGRSEYFDKLVEISKSSKNEQNVAVALASMFEIKGHFSDMTRLGNTDLVFTDPVTKQKSNDNDVPTEAIINNFHKLKNWRLRAKAVKILKSRKEFGVPELLLSAMNDDYLEVRKLAVTSFTSVTGYDSVDVFGGGGERPKQWWNENKERVEKDFKELQKIESKRNYVEKRKQQKTDKTTDDKLNPIFKF